MMTKTLLLLFLIMEEHMNIKKSNLENEIILSLEGWLDTQAAEDFEAEIAKIDGQSGTLVLDLRGLEYISSSGVRQVVAAHKKMEGRIVVRNTPENIMNVFSSIGIDKRVRFE